jgi:peptidyl-prolyl cis-trans isomerase C
MSKYAHHTLAAVALAVVLAAPARAADVVVAKINGESIYKKDVMKAIDQLPVKDAKVEQIYPLVIDQIVNEKLIDDAVAAAKITESEEYKKRLDIIAAQLSKQIYLEKAVSGKVSDGAVKAEYAKFKKENAGKTEIHARHILVPSEAEAVQVIKELDGGASFEDLANKRSSGPSAQNGGDLGYFLKEEMVPEFSDAAFKLKKGEYTKKPVKSSFGWHVIRVEDKREREVPELAQVEMAIRNKLSQDALKSLVDDLRGKAKVEIFDLDGKPVPAAKN